MYCQAEPPPTEYEKEEVETNAVPVSSGPDSSTTTAEYERGDSAQTQDDGGLGCRKAVVLFLLVFICFFEDC